MKGKVTPWAVLAISFLPHRKTQFAKADGTSGQSCQVQCLQQWSVPGASEALPPASTCMVPDRKDKFLLRPCSADLVYYWHTQRQMLYPNLGLLQVSFAPEESRQPPGLWLGTTHALSQRVPGTKGICGDWNVARRKGLQQRTAQAQDISLHHGLIVVPSRRAWHGGWA